MNTLYIFDLDGTIALCEHRRHFLDDKSDPDRWQKFYAACIRDKPNIPVIETLNSLYAAGADIYIWSERSAEVRIGTLAWLKRYIVENIFTLKMRIEGDCTPDEILKKHWLDSLSIEDRERLVAVFDDRQKVVDMWREAGVTCFQVAPGDF